MAPNKKKIKKNLQACRMWFACQTVAAVFHEKKKIEDLFGGHKFRSCAEKLKRKVPLKVVRLGTWEHWLQSGKHISQNCHRTLIKPFSSSWSLGLWYFFKYHIKKIFLCKAELHKRRVSADWNNGWVCIGGGGRIDEGLKTFQITQRWSLHIPPNKGQVVWTQADVMTS